MSEEQGFTTMNILMFLARRKELLALVFVGSLLLTYGAVYLLVEEQFEASAMIIPRGEDDLTAVNDLLKGAKGLPSALAGRRKSTETDLYRTIIVSRTMMENVVRRFDLFAVYRIDSTDPAAMELAVKKLRGEVGMADTDEGAFIVSMRTNSRQRAADITNYIVGEMNDRIIELKARQSKENREFLGKRVDEINHQMRASEDSLRSYQEESGLLTAKAQVEGIIGVHAKFESELAARELQKGILERQFDKASPQVEEVEAQIQAYRKKLSELRTKGEPGGTVLALKELPAAEAEFLRRYRNVEINNLLLQYITPLYEQAKIEEKKDYPVLQVIDRAIPPVKKSWPPRTLYALIGACSITIIVAFLLRGRQAAAAISDPKLSALLLEARTWRWSKKHPA